MSAENGKVCCNCRHCKRTQNEDADIKCHCEADNNRYLSYFEIMEGWCRHWAKEKEVKDGKSTDRI